MSISVNSRRSIKGSSRSIEGDFGTFGLSGPQQPSAQLPTRLDYLRRSGPHGAVLDMANWDASASMQSKSGHEIEGAGKTNIMQEDV